MKDMNKFDDILNECIERMFKGESIADCLRDFPEQAAELEPLLLTAAEAHQAADILPRPEFRQQAGYEFQAAIRDMKPAKGGFFRWSLRWVTAVSVFVAVLLAGGGTTAAAANSLPDDSLYQVKLFTEEVRLALTPSALGKAQLYSEFTDMRVEEIVKMAEEGNVEQVMLTTERMSSNLNAIAKLFQPDEAAGASNDCADIMLTMGEPKVAAVPPINGYETANATSPEAFLEIAPVPNAEMQRSITSIDTLPSTTGEEHVVIDEATLNNAVAAQAVKNTTTLLDALERAPESVKPALEKAIEIAAAGYEQALNNTSNSR